MVRRASVPTAWTSGLARAAASKMTEGPPGCRGEWSRVRITGGTWFTQEMFLDGYR